MSEPMDAETALRKSRRFFGLLCRHEWEILNTYARSYRPLGADLRPESYVPMGQSYDMRCKWCGWIRRIEG